MQIGIPKETADFESRVATTPNVVKKLVAQGHSVVIEQDAGTRANYSDQDYQQAGATIVDNAYTNSQVVLVVQAPKSADNEEAVDQFDNDTLIIGSFDPYRNQLLDKYAKKNITSYAMELLPRTLTRTQNMDVLSSQANLAGYKAVLMAANTYQRPFPMFMTSAGTVKPARVVILGVGVAGLQAIATAKRLGAVVEASDLRPSVKEQVESLGAKWLDVAMSEEEKEKAKGTGGYAWRPSEQYMKDQAIVVDKAVANADIVITTALIPGRDAPRLVHKATLDKMKAGSVLVDMAVATGGNVEGSKIGETVITDNGVQIIGVPNIPSTLASQCSELYANNLYNFFISLVDDEGKLAQDPNDEIQNALLVTNEGKVLLEQG